jgi:hypothetical protein
MAGPSASVSSACLPKATILPAIAGHAQCGIREQSGGYQCTSIKRDGCGRSLRSCRRRRIALFLPALLAVLLFSPFQGKGPPPQTAASQIRRSCQPDTPVLPALELVAVVAQAHPGADGLYRSRMSDAEIEQVAEWAQSRGHPLILDVQPGLSSFQAEVEVRRPFLTRPYVHLALDPEGAMAPGQVPGQTIGSVDASTVNEVIQTLAGIVTEHDLPPKVLIVHRFTEDMLTNAWQIQPAPQVQVAVTMDGVGGQAAKLSPNSVPAKLSAVYCSLFPEKTPRAILT